MVDITPPKYVRNVLRILSSHGYPACVVGGCVRDMFLRVPPNDWDVATAATPEEVISLFPDSIPTGIRHGTVTVRSGSQFVEVTTFRNDGEYLDHRHPNQVSFVGDLHTDLGRRDSPSMPLPSRLKAFWLTPITVLTISAPALSAQWVTLSSALKRTPCACSGLSAFLPGSVLRLKRTHSTQFWPMPASLPPSLQKG